MVANYSLLPHRFPRVFQYLSIITRFESSYKYFMKFKLRRTICVDNNRDFLIAVLDIKGPTRNVPILIRSINISILHIHFPPLQRNLNWKITIWNDDEKQFHLKVFERRTNLFWEFIKKLNEILYYFRCNTKSLKQSAKSFINTSCV